jgi:Tol biopolymer transport system component
MGRAPDEAKPVWSPDGRRVLFVGYHLDSPELFIAASDGSSVSPVTAVAGQKADPQWLVN